MSPPPSDPPPPPPPPSPSPSPARRGPLARGRAWWQGRSRFARNIGQVAGANLLAQALPVLAAPLLTRLYAPADFGVLALAASLLGLGLAVGTARFDWSMPNARSRGQAAALAVWGAAVLLLTALLAALLLAGWAALGATAQPGAGPGVGPAAGPGVGPGAGPGVGLGALAAAAPWAGVLAWLLPLALLGGGLQQLLQAWHVRRAALAAVGRAKVAQSVANTAVALAWPLAGGWLVAGGGLGAAGADAGGPVGGGAWGLLLGLLLGAWVGLWPLWRQAEGLPAALRRLRPVAAPARAARSAGRTAIAGPRLASAWRRFAGEAAWSTLASGVNTLSFAIVPLLLARHHGIAEVGWYALMQRVALGPVGLVGSAVSQSFWAEAAHLVRQDVAALRRLYLRSTARLVAVALPLGLLALAGPWLVGPLFGAAQWGGAGAVLAASAPLIAATVIASPLSHLVIHRRQHWQAAWDVLRVALLAAVIELAGRAGTGLVGTVLALSLVMAAMYALLVALNLLALHQAARRNPLSTEAAP